VPLMGLGRPATQSMLDDVQSGEAALVDGFKAARIVAKEGAVGRQERRVERSSTRANKNWRLLEEVKLNRRKAKRPPFEQHRGCAG
jgi:hypothetical protein